MKAGSLVASDDLLGVLDQPVVLGVEDEVDGGQADVLVAAPVTGDEVGVEQLVVVGCPGRRRVADQAVGVWIERSGRGEGGRGGVGDVGQEGVVGTDDIALGY